MAKSALILAWLAVGAGMAHATTTGTTTPAIVATCAAVALHCIAFYVLRQD